MGIDSMKCIICGKGSGASLYCSPFCSNIYYKGRKKRSVKYLLANLVQVRKQITKLYEQDLHCLTDYLSDREDDLYTFLEEDIGHEKLADILRKDFDDTQEFAKDIDLRGL